MLPEAPATQLEVTFARFEGKLDQVIVDHARRLDALEANSRAAGGKVMGWLGLATATVAVAISIANGI